MVILMCLGDRAEAQQINFALLRKYTQNQGLSSYNIRNILQDKFGYIWVATQDGLNRFDGMSFVIFNKNLSGKRKLSGTDIRYLSEDRKNGLLWVLTDQGIDRINTRTLEVDTRHSFHNAQQGEWNITMLVREDAIWIGTFNGLQVYQFRTGKSRKINNHESISSLNEVRHLNTDRFGNIWVGVTGQGIRVLNPETEKEIAFIPASKFGYRAHTTDLRFWDSLLMPDGQWLFATNAGLRLISYDADYHFVIRNNPCRGQHSLNTDDIRAVKRDLSGAVIVAANSGFFKFNNSLSVYTKITEQSGIDNSNWLRVVNTVCVDQQNDLWIGNTEGMAYIRYQNSPFRNFYRDPASGDRLEHILSLCFGRQGLYVGLDNGLFEVNQQTGKFIHMLKGVSVQGIYQDSFGVLHASFPSGEHVYQSRTWMPTKKLYPEFEKFPGYIFNSYINIGDSTSILGTENDRGILLWDLKKKKIRQFSVNTTPALSANIVNTVYRDKEQRIWVLSDKSITLLSPDFKRSERLTFFDIDNDQPFNIYFDICEAAGDYWLAAYGTGIIELDSRLKIKRIWNTRDGLSNTGVYKIFAAGDSLLFITSNNGLSVLNLRTKKFKRYYQDDGLHGNGFEEAAGTSAGGLIVAGGIKGFNIITPSKITENFLPPNPTISRIKIERNDGVTDTSNLSINTMDIPANTLQTTLFLSALNYRNPNRTAFYYRLANRNEKWTSIGNRNFINFIGLKPDEYNLEIKAANEDGYFSPILSVTLNFLPPWYKTTWFILLIATLIIAGSYWFYLMRIRQLLKEQEIRANIASDLHDDIGGTLNSIRMFTHLAISQDDKGKYLETISNHLDNAIAGLRDLIWVLDDKKDSAADFIDRLRQLLLPLCAATDIRLILRMDDQLYDVLLSKIEKRHLYFICKEAANNSVKYARCVEIVIDFRVLNGKKQLLICDDGIGFDTAVKTLGYGLKNMRSRAVLIKYDFSLVSEPSKGIRIELKQR
jgi:signal transduction histidine kinase/ligand-binding sensor domain-containing protein